MSGLAILTLLLWTWLAASLVYRLLALRAVARHCVATGGEPASSTEHESCVVLRPMRGAPPALDRCLASLLRAAEVVDATVVVGTEDPNDPACAIVEARFARTRGVRTALRCGAGPAGSNPKIRNLVQMAKGIDADRFVSTDADVELDPDQIRGMLAHFVRAEVGLVTSPHVSVAGRRFTSRLEALVANTHFLPAVCIALDFEGLRFALGAVIAVRGESLAAAGGFEALIDEPADDYALAHNVVGTGASLAWHRHRVRHHLDDCGMRGAFHRQARWQRATRHSRPISYVGLLIDHGAAAAVALALIGGTGLLAPLVWWGGQLGGLWRRRAILELRARDLALQPIVDVLAFSIFVAGFFGKAEPS